MGVAGHEIRYWAGPVSIGAHRPYNLRPYGHLHRLQPVAVFMAAVVLNFGFMTLLLLGSRPSPEVLAAAAAGDPSGSILEFYFVMQSQPQAIPTSGESRQRRLSNEGGANRPKSSSAFAPQRNAKGNVMDGEALRAIYRGQLQARLERTRPPPTALDALLPSPHCLLRVVQDVDGRIEELRILTCTGSSAWRDAVLSSIRSAAPLPMPPYAALHARSLEIEVSNAVSVRLIADDEAASELKERDPVNSTF